MRASLRVGTTTVTAGLAERRGEGRGRGLRIPAGGPAGGAKGPGGIAPGGTAPGGGRYPTGGGP
ncbi:hypothetical protein GCM10010472_28600 [Pseudonocardia halophobica]|uniref:Uncharacterized protein n=1 Tax=Pseudonocardia halophobica TaxID=29401 RepID=A0A9W6NTU8_9PSEU|nr:hypothetical protein GCM10017577_02590 [Pseudonocardia halophobica]